VGDSFVVGGVSVLFMGLPVPVERVGTFATRVGIAGAVAQLIWGRHGPVGATGDRVGAPDAAVVPTGATVGGAALVPAFGNHLSGN
jgi:hypothetical protein